MADDEEETDGDHLLDCDAVEDDAEIDEMLGASIMSDQEEHDYADLDRISGYGCEDELLGNATGEETPGQNGSKGGGDDDDDDHKDMNIDSDGGNDDVDHDGGSI